MPFVANHGVHIHYELEGRGTPLLLVHGLTGSLESWIARGYVEALQDHYRVVLVDLRGHGRSDRPHDPGAYSSSSVAGDIVAVLDGLGIERAHYMGYSMGSAVALGCLLPHTHGRLSSLILGAPPFPPVYSQEEAKSVIERVTTREEWRIEHGMEAAVAEAEAATGPLPEWRRAQMLQTDPRAVLALCRGCLTWPWDEELFRTCDLAALVFVGGDDYLLPDATLVADWLPHANLVVFPGLDHSTTWDHVDLILQHVLAFLGGIDEST